MEHDPLDNPNSPESLGYKLSNLDSAERIKAHLAGEGLPGPVMSRQEAIDKAREAIQRAPNVDVEWPE